MKTLLYFISSIYFSNAVTFLCPKESEESLMIAHPVDCRKYVTCVRGEPVSSECPEGSVFESQLQACDFTPDHHKCLTRTVEHALDATRLPDVLCPIGEQPNGCDVIRFAHPNECDRYFICNHGSPMLLICPEGLHFSTDVEVCDFPESAKCNNTISHSTQVL